MLLLEVLNSVPALKLLNDEKLPGNLAYAVAKNIRKIDGVIADFEKARVAIIKKYADGGDAVPEDKVADAEAEIQELLRAESGFTPHKVPADLLGTISVQPQVVQAVMWLFEE